MQTCICFIYIHASDCSRFIHLSDLHIFAFSPTVPQTLDGGGGGGGGEETKTALRPSRRFASSALVSLSLSLSRR